MSIVNSIIDDIIKNADYFKNNKQVDTVDLTSLFKHAMELVENEPLTGEQKKETVLTVIDHILELLSQRNIISAGLYTMLKESVKIVGPYMIDLVIMASKKLVELNKEISEKCKAKCFPKKVAKNKK